MNGGSVAMDPEHTDGASAIMQFKKNLFEKLSMNVLQSLLKRK
jgi:hypothetical protein